MIKKPFRCRFRSQVGDGAAVYEGRDFNEYGKTPKAVGEMFCVQQESIDNVYDIVPAVKQITIYEKYGHEGAMLYQNK